MIWNLSWYLNLLVLAVLLAILAKLVVILKVGWENSQKDNRSHTFKCLHSTATCFYSHNSLSLIDIIDKGSSKLELKIKEALHINWVKPNLNAQQNHLALILSLKLSSPLFSFLYLEAGVGRGYFFIYYFHYLWD